MRTPNQTPHLSKLLSYILRHKPSAYEIVLDENGYTNVDELINKLNAHKENINFEIQQYIIDNNHKKRFAFNDESVATQFCCTSVRRNSCILFIQQPVS